MASVAKIKKWGNSQGIRIPAVVLREAGMEMEDVVYIEPNPGGRLLITKKPAPKRGTIEYLFKDYTGESFEVELVNLGDAVGEEKW